MEVVIDDKSLKAGETIVILLLGSSETVSVGSEPLPNEIFRYTQPKDTRWRKRIKRIELQRR